jgi:hypothetical protein
MTSRGFAQCFLRSGDDMGFFVDLVAAYLAPARPLRSRRRVTAGGARAEDRNFVGEIPFGSSAVQRARAVSTDRSGGHEASPAAVHVLRIDEWMMIIRPHPRGLR